MGISKKAAKEHKKTCKKVDRGISNKKDLEVVWEQVFPEDAEQRIQRAFEILFNKSKSLS